MTRKITVELDIEEIGMLHKAFAVYLNLPSTGRQEMDIIERINKKISPPPDQRCWTLDLKEDGTVAMRQENNHRERYKAWWMQNSIDGPDS